MTDENYDAPKILDLLWPGGSQMTDAGRGLRQTFNPEAAAERRSR